MKKDRQGFTLIELLIGGIVMSVLLVGGYRVFVASTSQVGKTVSSTRDRAAVEKILDQIAGQVRNSYDVNDASTPLRLNQSPAVCGASPVSSSIVAFPGMDKTTIDNLSSSIDPSTANIDAERDGIRIAYVPSDSVPTDLVGTQVSPGVFKPYPTNVGPNSYTINIGNETAYENINVGDFFILSDTDGIRFGRVSHKMQDSSEALAPYVIGHSSETLWNNDRSSSRNYGLNDDGSRKLGGATVQKAGVSTYAYSPTDKTLLVNDHVADDGFNPIDKSFNYSAGAANEWRTLAENVDRFVIEYIVQDKNGSRFRTRRPIAGLVGQTGDCGNQIGLPYLKQIHVKLDVAGESYERLITPPRLRGLDQAGSSVVTVDVTPTPSGTPTTTPIASPTSGGVTPIPGITPSIKPTPIPGVTPSVKPTPPPGSPTPTPSPTATPSPTPTPTPTPVPTWNGDPNDTDYTISYSCNLCNSTRANIYQQQECDNLSCPDGATLTFTYPRSNFTGSACSSYGPHSDTFVCGSGSGTAQRCTDTSQGPVTFSCSANSNTGTQCSNHQIPINTNSHCESVCGPAYTSSFEIRVTYPVFTESGNSCNQITIGSTFSCNGNIRYISSVPGAQYSVSCLGP